MRQLALRAAVNRHWREKRQCLSPAVVFILEKAVKSIGNAVIPTFPMHRSYGFQHLRHKRPRLLSPVKVGNTTRLSEKNRTQRLARRNRGCFGWGWYHYPRSVPRVLKTLRGRGLKRQTLPFLGLGRGYSRRTQRASGTAMRLCASLSRGVAAPPGCVIFFASVEIGICTSGAHGFLRVRGRGGITTPGVLRMLLKLPAPACQSD